jgi:hypothetical protein
VFDVDERTGLLPRLVLVAAKEVVDTGMRRHDVESAQITLQPILREMQQCLTA